MIAKNKERMVTLLFILGILWMGLIGCASRTVYVLKSPPAPRVEVRVARPASYAVWIPGRWQWRRGSYVWIAGHWELKPKGTAWVPGHWQRRPRGWVWVPGHWRR